MVNFKLKLISSKNIDIDNIIEKNIPVCRYRII